MNFKNLPVARKLWITILAIVGAVVLATFFTQHLASSAYKQALTRTATYDARIQDALRWRAVAELALNGLIIKAM